MDALVIAIAGKPSGAWLSLLSRIAALGKDLYGLACPTSYAGPDPILLFNFTTSEELAYYLLIFYVPIFLQAVLYAPKIRIVNFILRLPL